MSYCRRTDSCDVYVLATGDGYIMCCGCKLCPDPFEGRTFTDRREVIQHLDEHRKAGHKVPGRPYQRLRREIRDIGYSVRARKPR